MPFIIHMETRLTILTYLKRQMSFDNWILITYGTNGNKSLKPFQNNHD